MEVMNKELDWIHLLSPKSLCLWSWKLNITQTIDRVNVRI